MVCEIKHYPDEERPYGMWVNNEYVGDYETMQEAAAAYEKMLKGEKEDAFNNGKC